jgi:hypothetical protein
MVGHAAWSSGIVSTCQRGDCTSLKVVRSNHAWVLGESFCEKRFLSVEVFYPQLKLLKTFVYLTDTLDFFKYRFFMGRRSTLILGWKFRWQNYFDKFLLVPTSLRPDYNLLGCFFILCIFWETAQFLCSSPFKAFKVSCWIFILFPFIWKPWQNFATFRLWFK